MDEIGPDEITFDPDLSDLGAILKAIANHKKLVPDEQDFIKAMLHRAWMFYDGEKITENEPYEKPAGAKFMDRYRERPEKIKEKETRFARKCQEAIRGSGQ